MPSTSKKQHNFMAAVANNPAFAKKAGVPQSVGKEFSNADKGRTFSKGGDMKKMNTGGSTESGGRGVVKLPGDKKLGSQPRFATKILPSLSAPLTSQRSEKEGAGFKRGGMAASKMGAVRTAAPSKDGIASKGKTKGTQIRMKNGGKC